MGVGKSPGRTPVKHFLLDSLVGKVNGVLSNNSAKVPAKPPLMLVDLCAGDGCDSESHTSSPSILYKHGSHPCGRKNRTQLMLIERDRASFDLLRNNVPHDDWVQMVNTDAKKYVLPRMKKSQAVFVHCDPNNVHQTPLTQKFVASFTQCTMYLATLGCNAEGIKRLPLDQRQGWFEYVDLLCNQLTPWHDAILFWLVKDSAQWAYLCNVPTVWREEVIELANSKKIQQSWKKGVGGVSLRRDEKEFRKHLERLFLTKDELVGQERMFT